MIDRNLTAERLRELLHYNPGTGVFTRLRTAGGVCAGSVSGYVANDGRVLVNINNHPYKAHRLAWLYVTGEWPKHDVDHRNGNMADNRFSNLRDVPHQVNQQNRQGPTKANRLKFIGVTPNRARFGAQIKIDGKRVWLGTYDTPEEAHAVYLEKKRKYHEGNTL
jgi:hypothetical protein